MTMTQHERELVNRRAAEWRRNRIRRTVKGRRAMIRESRIVQHPATMRTILVFA